MRLHENRGRLFASLEPEAVASRRMTKHVRRARLVDRGAPRSSADRTLDRLLVDDDGA